MIPQYIKINKYGNKFYYKDKTMNILHREDGPAVEYADGYKGWYLNGKRHREDGPAIEGANGYKRWYLNGKRHREDGPAIEYPNGYRAWYLNNEFHREDGPAIEWSDGYKGWYLNGVCHTEKEFKMKTAKEIVLTLDEIADKLGIDVNKLKIAK
jgi:hypothetical protein